MKKIFLVLAIVLIGINSNAQEIPQLKLTPKGVEPIVVNVDSLTANEIYKKALNWVQETYKNPDEVLKAQIENEKIRVDGFKENAFWWKSMGIKSSMDIKYSIEVSFRDGRYRFEYVIGQFYVSASNQKALYGASTFYKKSGEVRKSYKYAVPSLEETMNELSMSFYNYVSDKTAETNSDW